ncbi:LOW QUALITY PROTEIN: hypothetical protein MXB_3334 [Myxobolus squamalis]|nr:LOW QUALITY PROTEIN: hypothetical protein MXB_3334 [Myxobolus squamalis]
MVVFDNWSKFGFSFPPESDSSRAQISAYLIDIINFLVNDKSLSMWDIVDTMTSTVWGSQGSMAAISYIPYDPIPPDSHIFRSLNNSESIAEDPGVLCYSPGFKTTQPAPNDISYQLS